MRERLDESCDQTSFKVDEFLTGGSDTLRNYQVEKREKKPKLVTIQFNCTVPFNVAYQDQILNEIGQTSVTQDNQTSDGTGNAFSEAGITSIATTDCVRVHGSTSTCAAGHSSRILGLGLYTTRKQLKTAEKRI